MKFQITPELINTILGTPEQGIADLSRILNEDNYTELSLSGDLLDYSVEEVQTLFTHIATSLQEAKKISHLDVSFNQLSKASLIHLIQTIKTGTHLESINIDFNGINPDTAMELAGALKNHSILQVSGFDNSIGRLIIEGVNGVLARLNNISDDTIEALGIPRDQIITSTRAYLTEFQNGLTAISAIHRHAQNLPAFILNPIRETINDAQETALPIIEFLLTEIPPRAQQALEAISTLEEAHVNATLTQLSQQAVTAFANLQPANVQQALLDFCPNMVQTMLALFPNQIAAQAANQAGGMAGMAMNFMPQGMLNAVIAPMLTVQLQAIIMQLPAHVHAQLSQMLANLTPAELTALFAQEQQRALTLLNHVKDFHQRLVAEFGPAPLQGLTQASAPLLSAIECFR